MKWHGVLFLTAGLLLAADSPKAATDHDKIQGVWKITAEIEEGKESPPARNEKGAHSLHGRQDDRYRRRGEARRRLQT